MTGNTEKIHTLKEEKKKKKGWVTEVLRVTKKIGCGNPWRIHGSYLESRSTSLDSLSFGDGKLT